MDALPDAQQLRSDQGLPTVVLIAASGKMMPITGKHMPTRVQPK